MNARRALVALIALWAMACANRSEAPISPGPASIAAPDASASSSASTPPSSPCAKDDDCGYDPAGDRCGNDPRYNRQPPIVDQGVICFCDDRARVCETLRIWPIPCESDASCAVRLEPRPHPVAATVSHPHEHGKACVDYLFSTTCERTNICTMHKLTCDGGPAR